MTMFLPLEISQDREGRPAVPPPGRQKRTSDERPLMSALPPIADIAAGQLDVRFVPKADSSASGHCGRGRVLLDEILSP
jgi:hypothetical protein